MWEILAEKSSYAGFSVHGKARRSGKVFFLGEGTTVKS